MNFVEAQGRHYIVVGEVKILINYITRPDPEAFGAEVPTLFKTLLDDERAVFDIYFTGDRKYLVHTNYEPMGFTANLSELREDGHGMKFPEPIPRISESAGLPMVSAKNFGEDTGFHIHQFDEPFREVSKLIIKNLQRAIDEDGETQQ